MRLDPTADLMTMPKHMDIREFREQGFLQEANRLFFHPLGLALEVVIDDADGSEHIGGVWDYRDDPEGVLYGEDVVSSPQATAKEARVRAIRIEKYRDRTKYRCDPLTGVQLLG